MEAGVVVGIVFGTLAILFLLVIIILLIARKRNRGPGLYMGKTRIDGKTVIITGATEGIGKVTAFDIAGRGARVILACRNIPKAKIVADEITHATGNTNIITHYLDTSKLTSVREFCRIILETEDRLDILVLNAGITGNNDYFQSEDKIEITMATNHFGHFLITNLLSGLVVKSAPSRIISVSSKMHYLTRNMTAEDIDIKERNFALSKPYSMSKTCNIMLCGYLAPILKNHNVTINSLCPGLTETKIFGKGDAWFTAKVMGFLCRFIGKTIEEGAATLLYLAVDEKVEDITGKFFVNCKEETPTACVRNEDLIKKVWQKSEDMVNLTEEEKSFLKGLMP